MQRLDPDPRTAANVRWIFPERRQGRSIAGIARALNDTAVACPSTTDAERNPHRHHDAWTTTSVAAILANPRYTGHQVCNRQHTEHTPILTAPEDHPGGADPCHA